MQFMRMRCVTVQLVPVHGLVLEYNQQYALMFFLDEDFQMRFIPVCFEFVHFDCLIRWVMLEASSSSDGTKRAAEVAVFHQDIFLLDRGRP